MSTAAFALSLAVHVGTFLALGAFPLEAARRPLDPVEVSVVEEPAPVAPAPLPEPPAEEPVAEPPPKPVVRAPKAPKELPPEEPKPEEPPAPAEETIADFSGTTLTGEGGWASAVGSGAPMAGPIGSPTGVVTGRNREGVQGGVIGGTGLRVVAEGDLSRRPKPPDSEVLNAALVRSYPKTARQQGVEGVARIRIRVLASGKLQPLAAVSETYPGFADACKSSLRDVSFQPGLDQKGQPVATDISYTCRFTVE